MDVHEINGRSFTSKSITPPTKANRMAREMVAMLGSSLSGALAGVDGLDGAEIASLLANLDDPKLDAWLPEMCRHAFMLDAAGNPIPVDPDRFAWSDPYEMIVVAAMVAKNNGFFTLAGTLNSLAKMMGIERGPRPADSSETST
jgi:hypothetical protein